METINHFYLVIRSTPILAAATILAASLAIAFVVKIIICRVFLRLTRKTRTTLDDDIVKAAARPLFFSIFLLGSVFSVKKLNVSAETYLLIRHLILTLIVLLWTGAFMRMGKSTLKVLAKRAGTEKIIQNRTLPLFEMIVKFLIIGGAMYSIFLTWNVDVTAWLASAGIVGIAVGFAAKDTLANFFSGIFILADAPYKIGDFIVLDSGERGKVTDIGIRSTRILTMEDIQIIIPNAAIGAAKIVNESGGPHPRRRISAAIGVSYGSDIDKVRSVLLGIAKECPFVVDDPQPLVRFRSFGDSALNFELLSWISEPGDKDRAIDMLNTMIFKRFKEESITIPFPQQDIHIQPQSK